MIAYCGIDCSKCKSYIATQSGKRGELEKVARNLAQIYHAEVKPEYVVCDGCKADKRHSYFCSNRCNMRPCCMDRNYTSCIECSDFPCAELELEIRNKPEAWENLEKMR
ncbi:DUF3795 domain-containing protein [Desulfoluna spongiiphila]|uniref:DUF3795 domain-containing protein n=1 Tax=Desulfoluna spongiiphila TaxID=419481 RepID=UPI000B818D72